MTDEQTGNVEPRAPGSTFHHPSAIALCAVLLGLYAVLAIAAVSTKSPTFDEPKHALAASIALESRDFRIDYDNPPLWKYWAALPNAAAPPHVDTTDAQWERLPFDLLQQWPFTMRTLYRDPQNDPDRLIGRSRFMMLLVAVALGALIARWAWELGGPAASVAAALLFALDPNFLAHGPLVKNDVALALLLAALSYVLWRFGPRIRWPGVLAVGLLCGAGCTVKLSGVLLPLVAAVLWLGHPFFPLASRDRDSRARVRQGLAAAARLAAVAVVTFAFIWTVYGFRFSVSPDPGVAIDTRRTLATIARNQTDLPEPVREWSPPLQVRAVLWSLDHRLLPEPWLNGFLFVHAGTLRRPLFLMGRYSDTGWPGYYPLAVLFKTPLATLAAFASAAVVAGLGVRRAMRAPPTAVSTGPAIDGRWSLACLAIPPITYALFALTTPAASGLRHLLPVYPFLFIACGLAAAAAWRWRAGRWGIGVIATALAIETIAAFPDYIAYFNVAAGGERGGIRLLSDSNLDWGQDLPLLADWQRRHPEQTLYLSYFGTSDPAHYRIRYTNLPVGYALGPPPQRPSTPGVIAVSATNLQKWHSPHARGGGDSSLWDQRPIEVLGGSIYLYRFPPPP
jgi:hypothetical protein